MDFLNTKWTRAGTPRWKACVGVDASGDAAVAVKATRSWSGITYAPLPAPAAAGRLPVAATLPVHTSFLRTLRAPFASAAKAQKVWPALLDIHLPFPLADATYGFLPPVTTADGQTETTAVAARREDVEAWRVQLAAAGYPPWRVEHEGVALWGQSIEEAPLDRASARVVCLLGAGHTALVWGQGTRLLATSGLRLGARALLDPERGPAVRSQLIQRISAFVRAQTAGEAQELQWAWCGEGAARPDLLLPLQEAIASVAPFAFFVQREPASFLARAAATRALRAPGDAASLLPEDLEPPALRAQRQAQALRAPLGLAAAALLLLGVNLAGNACLDAHRDHLQQEIEARATALAGTAALPRGQEVLLAERALKEQAPAYVPFRDLFQPSLLGVANDLLRESAARGLSLERLSVAEKGVLGQGDAPDEAALEALAALLTRAGWLASWERREGAADHGIPFTLKASR